MCQMCLGWWRVKWFFKDRNNRRAKFPNYFSNFPGFFFSHLKKKYIYSQFFLNFFPHIYIYIYVKFIISTFLIFDPLLNITNRDRTRPHLDTNLQFSIFFQILEFLRKKTLRWWCSHVSAHFPAILSVVTKTGCNEMQSRWEENKQVRTNYMVRTAASYQSVRETR